MRKYKYNRGIADGTPSAISSGGTLNTVCGYAGDKTHQSCQVPADLLIDIIIDIRNKEAWVI